MRDVKRYDSYGYDGLSGLMKEHADGDSFDMSKHIGETLYRIAP